MRHNILGACWLALAIAVSICSSASGAASEAGGILLPDGGRYIGALVGGMRQGTGRIEWSNGARYEGGFDRGLFSGAGMLRFPNGDVYEGEFEGGMQSGRGRLAFGSGAVYSGEFQAGKIAGRGRFEYANGAIYEGELANSEFNGRGRLSGPSGEYLGEFKRGQMSGLGQMRFKDGRVYVGGFADGEFHGKGRLEYASGPIYEGDFVAGAFSGEGLVTWPGGGKHQGHFRDWRPEGPGSFNDGNGTSYRGTFENGELAGSAHMNTVNGSRYHGEFKHRMPHGQGEMHLPNGDVYKGAFEFGDYHGAGTLTYAKPLANGQSSSSGLWQHGRLKKEMDDERRLARANAERALYTQPELLARALRGIGPRDPAGINMYVLAVAGYGSQEVFRREVDFVRNQFDTKFGTRGRSLALINSRTTVGSVPMATVSSIRRAVLALARSMDKQRDILFVYLSSHGSKDEGISLNLSGVDLPPLQPQELAAIFKDAGIRWKVIVVSACYSGGFLDKLRDPHTLVITAARHDRRSFGCADENEFTYFGRAFFKEALPKAASFEQAFSTAAGLITEWENRDAAKNGDSAAADAVKDGERHSLPQIAGSPAIRDHLKKWREQLSAARGKAQPTPIAKR